MLIWILLFFAVITISFILALKSMSDFLERPSNFSVPYSLFLVRKSENFTSKTLDLLHQDLIRDHLIISVERLFKGDRKALAIFGPVPILRPLVETLDLLELEDYSQKIEDMEALLSWEMAAKDNSKIADLAGKPMHNPLQIKDPEELWIQFVLKPVSAPAPEAAFETMVRLVIKAKDKNRALDLQNELLNVGEGGGLALLPQAYSTSQLVKLYNTRSFLHPSVKQIARRAMLVLTSEKLQSLFKFFG